jgi:hypothetical protein
MPLFRYICNPCNKKYSKLLAPERAQDTFLCALCSQPLERASVENFTIVKETIDTGTMTRRVEQYANSPDLIQEREELGRKDKDKKTL